MPKGLIGRGGLLILLSAVADYYNFMPDPSAKEVAAVIVGGIGGRE